MRRNQRPSYDYHKHKTPFKDIEDYDYKPKLTDVELRSLECSSVQEAHQTNQSYQNSWLEKLVNNMDEDKFNHAYTDTNARNFTRKSTYISPNIRTAQIPNDNYTRQRSAVSCSSKKNDYTPFSRIPQISSVQQEDYPVSRFRNSDNQRIARTYSSNSQHYRIDRPISLTQAHDKKVPKEVDLNESGQSYGRIKRVQKQRQGNQTISKYETNIGSNLQQLDIPSIRLSTNNDRRERERLSTQTQAVLAGNGKSSDNYFREKRDSKQISMGNFEDASGLKRRSSEYFWSKEDPLKYQKYEYRRKTSEFSNPIINRQTNKQKSCVSSNGAREKSSAEKKYDKQDDCKMEQMAKKLNMVLQNISKKSKMIQSSHQPEENKSVKASSISTSSQILQRRNTEVTQPYEQRYRSYSLAMEEQSRAPVKVEEQVKVMAESRSKQKASQQEQYKYQMMKKSLGMSKHIPHEIILEQSSSQINSQISPRTEYLNRQFKVLFDKLDKNGSGELTKHNCAFENVHDEVKYLFGAIFSKIKYKNERVSFKSFIQECQNIVKEFQFQQLKEVLSKSKNITIFKLNEKDTDSERWNNETNNESETKRSSDRSQVVKKYEFTDQSVKVQKIDNSDYNKSKVQWLPTTKYENLVIQKSQNKRTGISRNSYGTQKQPSLETKDLNRFSNAASSKLPTKLSSQADRLPQNYTQSAQKQKQEQYQRVEKENSNKDGLEKQRQKKDFEKMCENLNNKLNNYLTSISKKNTTTGGHHIPLQFSELSKHWNGNKL